MKEVLKISMFLSVFVTFLFVVSCADDEQKPENFKTQQEAQDALYESDFLVFFALDMVNEAAGIADDFDGTSYPSDFVFKNRSSASLSKGRTLHALAFDKKRSPNTFGYNAQSGYWVFDTTSSYLGFTETVSGKIRFTPRHLVTGLPNDSTNKMEYDLLVSANGSGDGGAIDLHYDTKLDVTGIAAFRDSTGNATMIGSTNLAWLLDFTDESGTFLYKLEFSNAMKTVVVSPTSPYPQSGTIEFTSKGKIDADNVSEEYYVAGSIAFDGSNIAVLVFGGYTFHINLDGPYIVELD